MRAALIAPLILIPLLIFSKVRHCDFINLDDNKNLTRFERFNQPGRTAWDQIWSDTYLDFYVPLTHTTWYGLSSFARVAPGSESASHEKFLEHLNPAVFHLANLFFHLASGAAVYGCLVLLVESPWAAFLGSLFFMLHPTQVETFAWASNLRDVLAGFLVFSGLFFYLDYCLRSGLWRFALCGLCFILALLSKPTSLVFPLFVAVLGYFQFRKPTRQVAVEAGILSFLGLPVVMRTAAIHTGEGLYFTTNWLERPWIAFDAVAFYCRNLFVLTDRTLDYGRSPAAVLSTAWPYIHAVWIGLALTALYIFRRRVPRTLLVGCGLFIVGLLPVLGLQPFHYQLISTVADRYAYFSFFGVSLAIAFAVRAGWPSTRLRAAGLGACALALCVLSAASWRCLDYWKNTRTVFENTIRLNPNSWVAYNNLGFYYEAREEYERAVDYYLTKAELNPHISPLYRAGVLLVVNLNQPSRAVEVFKKALAREPDNSVLLSNTAYAALASGELVEARILANRALAVDPGNDDAKKVLSDVEANQGRRDLASSPEKLRPPEGAKR